MKNKLKDKFYKDQFLNIIGQFILINIVGLSFSLLVKFRGDHNGDDGNLFMLVIFLTILLVSIIILIVKLVKLNNRYNKKLENRKKLESNNKEETIQEQENN